MISTRKYYWLKRFFCLILIFIFYSYCYAKDINRDQTYWILDKYVKNHEIKKHSNEDYLNNLRVKFENNIFYVNDSKYSVILGKAENISKLVPESILHTDLLKYFTLPKNEINYIQFDSSVDSEFSELLLPDLKVIYLNEELIFINQQMALSFIKSVGQNSFKKISKTFPSLKLPYNSRITGNYVWDSNYNDFYYSIFNENKFYTQNIPRNFLNYLELTSNNNLSAQWNNYIANISGIKLPFIHNKIRPILIEGIQENGEKITYLYLFSDNYMLLDKLLLRKVDGLTRKESQIDDLAQGFIYFEIDENYLIERQQRFADETIEIQHYKITKDGKFKEIPVTSDCYKKSTSKDDNPQSKKSLLLTSNQGNNYLRFADGLEYDEFESTILTLMPNEKVFCIDYQRSFPITLGKMSSKKFFNNNELYQWYIEKFKRYNIDISEELQYITINNIEKTPISKFLLNGNKAIYMEDTLFIVGENHFAAYRQPNEKQIINQENN